MNQATAAFIRSNANGDVRQLALRGTKDPEVDLTFALDQIAGRQTARKKLPSWAAVEGIVYPPHLSMEQCSSEQTARYKAGVAGRGRRLVDLTGGFGVDFSFMAQGFAEAVYVERQPALCDIARQNFDVLGLRQAEVVCADSEDYLRQMAPVDLIYIDPARRDSHGGRTYGISDCTPDVVALMPLLTAKADRVIIKLSPMLDWRKAVSDLGEQYVGEVHIVSVGNECKEMVVETKTLPRPLQTLQTHPRPLPVGRGVITPIACVNILSDDHIQMFHSALPSSSNNVVEALLPSSSNNGVEAGLPCSGDYSPPYREGPGVGLEGLVGLLGLGLFLYEPNASIMKAGCFAELSQHFGIAPIATNSHLFVSADEVDGFPGRTFVIDAVTTLNKRDLKVHLAGVRQANITMRNFPLTVAELRKRLKLSEGGSTYIFATTLANGEKVLLICSKKATPLQQRRA